MAADDPLIGSGTQTQPEETYVYEGTEVIKTGRTASRKAGTVTDTLYEIKPASQHAVSWLKWVKERDLYKVDKK